MMPEKPASPGIAEKKLALSRFTDLPGWEEDTVKEALPAFLHSCRVLKKEAAWRQICQQAENLDGENEATVKAFFETNLQPWQIRLTDGTETGMATGYYEPLLYGSRICRDDFSTPLYRTPPDLKRRRPYHTRKEIRQSNCLAGHEIVWVNDAVDAFFLQIQGSGRVLLAETGETIRLAYAAQNGRPYYAIGRYLIDMGEIEREEMSAPRIRAWLAEHPDRMDEVMDTNPSYVFFREEKLSDPSLGPKGAMGVPLTAGRSVAVDRRYIALGTPLFIETTVPSSEKPLRKMVMAQDTGGAIKGVIRVDYFCGFGSEAAEMAGSMKQPLRLWMFLPKNR